MRILALDYGRKRIGVAVSDELCLVARILTTIQSLGRNADAAVIAGLVQTQAADRVILGLPLHLSGAQGAQAGKVHKFGAYLATQLGVPVEYWDERFTSVEAARLLTQAGIHPRKQRDQIDATAAAILLQSYLDAHPHLQSAAFGGPGPGTGDREAETE
ncbi:MAG TPA: Holliday junction resolvase RuvX [Chloroflexia bacterium]|nr:Holliday junction resolvase RuvX [Chloroflexia bacterium]